MPKFHGKGTYLAIDDLDGSLTSIRAKLDSIGYTLSGDRPETTVYGDRGERHELLGFRRGTLSVSGFFTSATAKVHGKNTRILLQEFSVSSMLDSASVSRSVGVPNTETFGDEFDEHDLKGQLVGSFSFGGPFAGATGEIYAILKAQMAAETPAICSLAPNGFAVGSLVEMGYLAPTEKGLGSPLKDKATISLTAPCDGEADLGVSLLDLAAVTTTFDGTGVDETEASANGGVGHLHVTAFSGTNGTFKIQHSTDNVTFADLISFVSVTAVGSQRIELAAGTAVNRYVRAICSTDNFTSATIQISFARRDFAYGTAGTHRHFVGLLPKESSSTFEFGPEGNASGKTKVTGEVVLTSYNVTYPLKEATKFQAEFMSSGTITDSGTF
jgi:hypothetical protein